MDFYGLEELRKELEDRGYRSYPNYLKSEYDECNWIACKRITAPCRECETNEGKGQYVITPHSFTINGHNHKSYTLGITGEYEGNWYELEAYGLDVDNLSNLSDVEMKILKAWNGLGD